MTKGKFTSENPHRSSYANPEYKADKFEKYYTSKKGSKNEETRFHKSFYTD